MSPSGAISCPLLCENDWWRAWPRDGTPVGVPMISDLGRMTAVGGPGDGERVCRENGLLRSGAFPADNADMVS